VRLTTVALLVRDYDEAITWFTQVLGFALLEDTTLSPTKRWVRVAPSHDGAMSLLLARAATPAQVAMIGQQGAGRVWLFLHSDDFAADHERLLAAGVVFEASPRDEAYGRVAVFADPYGNRWDLVESAAGFERRTGRDFAPRDGGTGRYTHVQNNPPGAGADIS
jgi:catechol 2,3-dioxygenase-like lactoylglutathione lyase family enzyme